MLRLLIALAVTAVCVLFTAPASGKGDVRATLEGPLPANAKAGQMVTLAWTLSHPDSGTRRPFGAGGVYVRLLSASGAASQKALGKAGLRGRYVARVRVPEGGIGGIRIGLEGVRLIDGRSEGADIFFPIENDPFAAAVDRAVEGGSFPVWLPLVGLGALGAILTGGRILQSQRRSRLA